MKKKTRAAASGTAKRRETAVAGRKAAPRGVRKSESPVPAPSVDPKSTIRRLKTQLTRAMARIEDLQASADHDFMLDIPNRRGCERELHRAFAYIKR